MSAAPSRHFQGLASPSPVSVTSNKDSRIYRTSHGLWAQLSSNTCLEKKRSFRGRSVKVCGAAHHTDRLLTRSQRTGQPLAANALPHGNLLHDRLVLGFQSSVPHTGFPGTLCEKCMQVSTSHRTGKGKIQTWGQLSNEVFQLHYFSQGFESLRTKFHLGREFKKNGFSLPLFRPFEETQSEFFAESTSLSRR